MDPAIKTSYKTGQFNASATLDHIHDNYLHRFHHDQSTVIPALQRQLRQLQKVQKVEKSSKKTSSSLEQDLVNKDKMKQLTKQINTLTKQKQDYLLDNSKLVFEYFDQKKNISNGTAPQKNNPSIRKFFNMENEVVTDNTKTGYSIESKDAVPQNVVKKYMYNIHDKFINMDSFSYSTTDCDHCGKGYFITNESEGIMVCNQCFHSITYLVDEKQSYKEPPKEINNYAYERKNHFKEVIAQVQGKETTLIPPIVFETILKQLKKERISITDEELTNRKMREIMKKLNYTKYYDHISFIRDKFGIVPPIMSPHLEDLLFSLFDEIQTPYMIYCPTNRSNFLHYHYTGYKLCEYLGETKYLKHFQMLKYQDKVDVQDTIWKKICAYLHWPFIPTVIE